MYEYDNVFYNYINKGAIASAQQLIPALIEVLPNPVESVLDVGCGAGAWLSVWKCHHSQVTGLDGEYVRTDQLLIEPAEFVATDLRKGFTLNQKFSLAQSLEVAEHLPKTVAKLFVESLCRHSDMVLFSAATPGQGGENHLNEQPYSYWRDLFQQQGYGMYDPVRRAVAGKPAVKPWYRYNTFLYVNARCSDEILDSLSTYLVDPATLPMDLAPLSYRARKQLVKFLPAWASTGLAIFKKYLFRLLLKLKISK